MIKATAKQANGKDLLIIGLSFGNLDKFRAEPGDTFIKILGENMGISMDVLIFSGQTEAHMQGLMSKMIGPNTIIHIDPKLKS